MKTVTRDDNSQNMYYLPFGRCIQQTSVEDSRYKEKRNNALIVPGGYISKKESSKISEKKTMRLYMNYDCLVDRIRWVH